jgi:hypothetical protein
MLNQYISPKATYVSSLPTELVLGIFCSFSAFPDILHLAATCQGGPRYETPTVPDVLIMTRNSIVIEKSIDLFSETVVERMTSGRRALNPMLARARDLHWPKNNNPTDSFCETIFKHNQTCSRYLTQRERLRFIRATYQL